MNSSAVDSLGGSLLVCRWRGQTYTFNTSFCHLTSDSGKERALTQSSLCVSLLPSMDYLWAGDDRSAGLQSGWLGSGKFLLHFLTHPGASKAKCTLSHSYSYFAAPVLPNVKIWFSFGQMVLLCLYFGKTICWELELEVVANERRSMLQVLAELGHHLLPFPPRIYLPSSSLMWCFWVHVLKYS